MGTSLKKVAKKAKDYKYVLLVMRHAKTEPFGDGGDAGRELTDKGRKQAKAVRVCTKVGCSRYLTSLPRPRRSIASCWYSAMSPLCRSHANGWRAPNRMQCCSTC